MITQTPWIERKFDFNFPVGLFQIILERLRGTMLQLQAMVKNLPEQRLSYKDGDRWSVKEQVGHLYDLEELWCGRIEDFLAGKETLRAADMSNSKTTNANHNSRSMDELLKQFVDARNKLIVKVENIDEATAAITALHPRLQKPMRLVDSLFLWPNMMIITSLRSVSCLMLNRLVTVEVCDATGDAGSYCSRAQKNNLKPLSLPHS